MKRSLPYLFLIVLTPIILYLAAVAQETGGGAPGKDGAAVESREEEKTAKPSGNEIQVSDAEVEAAAKEARKKAEKKKKENKKQPAKKTEEKKRDTGKEEARKEIEVKEDIDRSIGDNLLMIENLNITENRIPGISIKKDEASESIVKVPDTALTDKDKKEKKDGGLFGSKTDTIAKWGLLVLLFLIFIIYKTRSKKSRKKVVRILTKR